MKSKGWAIFRLMHNGMTRVPFDPGGWQNEHGNHMSKKAATVITSRLLEQMPDNAEFVILEVFGKTSSPSPDKGG